MSQKSMFGHPDLELNRVVWQSIDKTKVSVSRLRFCPQGMHGGPNKYVRELIHTAHNKRKECMHEGRLEGSKFEHQSQSSKALGVEIAILPTRPQEVPNNICQ